MEGTILKCPLCCDKTFESKPDLVEHLSNILDNITCSICSNKWPTVAHLIEHLTLDNCQTENTGKIDNFDIGTEPEKSSENAQLIPIEYENIHNVTSQQLPTADSQDDVGSMYVEFLSKQLAKPCLQTQELKLVKDDGGTRYVFLMNDEENNSGEMDAVVTKQNNDGTISLTTVKDMKLESDLLNQESPEPEESEGEIYSCNTCGVSFTSVLEHIQNYHNDQDVVVEEPLDDMDIGTDNMPLEMEENQADHFIVPEKVDKQTSRRMITETGDIVEAPLVVKSNSMLELSPLESTNALRSGIKEERGVKFTRQFVTVDSVVKEIKQTDNKSGPYHKVMIKEIEKQSGEKIKIFNCKNCHVYVSSLEEFKSKPCKQSKYACPHCPVFYENSKSLCAHMKVHKAKPGTAPAPKPSVFECAICNTEFQTNKSLKLHKRMHDPIKARPIEPPVEGTDGAEVSNDKFLCFTCNKFIPIDYRSVHQKSHKKGKANLNCDICNKEFISQEYLEMHMNVHLNEKMPVGRQDKSLPYMCLYCDRRFSRPHEKVKHERIHTGEKPHSCEICGKSFRVSYCLTLHMRTHTGARPYSCPHCGKRFKAHSVYNHHLLTHSEVRAYKCPYCPKAFKTSVQLAGHKNSHTKPFSCQHCNRPFASLYAVRVHTETHARQNNLKFSCSMCGASYARAFALKDHIKAVHNKDAEKSDLEKARDLVVTSQKEADQANTIGSKEDWAIRNEENATEVITIDTKNLTNEVDVSSVFVNGSFS